MATHDSRNLIRVRGAKEHNLQKVDVDIPRDRLVVITGLSGSGKSSLAFDTIFAEGQRKYMESLSAYARQFLDQLQKPDMEGIEGLPPTIAIEQRSGSANPRSTVATTTEIYDYLRLLYARCGTPRCWHIMEEKKGKGGTTVKRCGREIKGQSATQIVDAIMGMGEGAKLLLMAPVVRGKKGFHRDVLEELHKDGMVRARVDGKVVDLRDALKEPGENPLGLGRYEQHDIEAVVDRVIVKAEGRQRVADSVETALKVGHGSIVVARAEGEGTSEKWTDATFSEKYACPDHPECSLEELEPRLFSFNSPFGACGSCAGLGTIQEFDADLVVGEPDQAVAYGAITAWTKIGAGARAWFTSILKRFCKRFKVDPRAAYSSLSPEIRRIVLYGATAKDEEKYGAKFKGVIPSLQEWFTTTQNPNVKEKLSAFLSQTPCPTCGGQRLKIEALHVFLEGGEKRSRANISDVTGMTVRDAEEFFGNLALSEEQKKIAGPILKEVHARLGFLASVGLNYLNLSRRTGTLSGGEAQRIRLATQVGTGLVGVCYVLDEPTIGLHQRDNDRLIGTLRRLSDIGNTVIVVEHDEEMIRAADHILDMGPGAGVHGGRIISEGTYEEIVADGNSVTARYLSGQDVIERPSGSGRKMNLEKGIVIRGAKENNLKNIDVRIPLGGLVCVTGVSGSGKSTLVNEILLKAAMRELSDAKEKAGAHAKITGLKPIARVVDVDQTPIGRTPRSNPATYTGIWDDIRTLYTKTKEAKIRGYEPGRFSFNVKGGRCEACEGQGTKKIEMHFLPDVYVQCEVCKGARFNRETLEVTYRHKTIADVLRMTVEEGIGFFEAHAKTLQMLTCLRDVGLDYIELGQPSTTLSGGEAQRVKLATELGKGPTIGGETLHTLYVLDEPTTGLHFADVKKLLSVLDRLAERGHTLVVIEHNLDVIKCADWIIDLGPEGGDAGGRVVAEGPPAKVMACAESHTGRYLKMHLQRERERAGLRQEGGARVEVTKKKREVSVAG